LDQNGYFSVFSLVIFNATGKTTDKLRKPAKNGILISNALFIARAMNIK